MSGTKLDNTISRRAIDLILGHEGHSHADWPGGASGITIGRGYDLGYHTEKEFSDDWSARLPADVFGRLRKALGIKGEAAKALAPQFRGIRISREAADAVFLGVDVPRWIARARATFPGYDRLPDDAQGALVSIVFNRGTSMGTRGKASWESRREMRGIRDVLAKWSNDGAGRSGLPLALDIIAGEIRSMKRLWVNAGLGGLLRRREDEAKLVDAAAAEVRRELAADPKSVGVK